jgi:hypothetical protein
MMLITCAAVHYHTQLSHNGITSAGAAALGYALTAISAVQTLCLAYNEIGCKGATGIGNALAVNFSLTTLDLSTVSSAIKCDTSIASESVVLAYTV